MADRGTSATGEVLRALAARRGLVFSERDLAAGAAQLEGILQALEQLDQFDVAALEPTTYLCFDDGR